jgi:hypothetical protein
MQLFFTLPGPKISALQPAAVVMTRRPLRRLTDFFRTSGSKKTGSYPVDQNNLIA